MRVAVTGGSGRIGSRLVTELLSRGHEVINLDRRPPPQQQDLHARYVCGDVTDRAQVQAVLEQVDAVCHLGEIPNANVPLPREEVYAHNTRAAAVVLQTAAELKLRRAIYTSSCQVYGLWEDPRVPPKVLPFDETHPLAPQNVYSLSKVANEAYAQLMGERYGLSVAAFRLPWVFQDEYSDRLIEHLKTPTRTDGFATYVHVSDAVRAYALALGQPRPGFEAYHFTAAEVLSLEPLAERLRLHHPAYPLLPAGWPAYRSPVLTTKARDHFGWEPSSSFQNFRRERLSAGKAMSGGSSATT